jgi:heptosyltransferase-2
VLTAEHCVCVFAPNWLGDAVMALPAIADLRRHFAGARFVVAARPSVASLFELVPGIDAVVTLQWRARLFSGRTLQEDIVALRTSCNPAARDGDSSGVHGVALMLPNSFATAWLAKRALFVERWGYATDWRRQLLTRPVRQPRASMHQGRYYQHLTEALGIVNGPLEPQVDVPEGVREKTREQLSRAGWDGRQTLVAMAPGAAYGTAKRWLPKYFAEVIALLQRDHKVRTVLVGSAGDAETIRIILRQESARGAQPIDMVGATSLHGLAGVLAMSAACLSNDSGAMHLAGAIGTPVVALFGPTRETETAPLTRADGYRDVLINPVWCRPCMLRECPIDHRCMKGLRPALVLESVARAIAQASNPNKGVGRALSGPPGEADGLRPTRIDA